MDYDSWHLNHPFKTLLLLTVCMVAVGSLGVFIVTLTIHAQAAADEWASALIGMGSAALGAVLGFVIIDRIDARETVQRFDSYVRPFR